jgi:hypothetical protein
MLRNIPIPIHFLKTIIMYYLYGCTVHFRVIEQLFITNKCTDTDFI